MEINKPLARAGYLLGALLVLIPLSDATSQVMPLRFGDERWRFGAVGQLSNLLLVPLLGFLIVIAIATLRDSRRVKRVIGAVCGILALILAVLSVLFILDYFQARAIITPKFQHAIAVATGSALVKNVISIVTLVLLSRADQRPLSDVWPIRLSDPLPGIPVPLLSGDADVPLDLQQAFTSVYDAFRYEVAMDYTRRPRCRCGPTRRRGRGKHLASRGVAMMCRRSRVVAW